MKSLFISSVFFFFASVVSATTPVKKIYVNPSTGGTYTNSDGTESKPYKTLWHAMIGSAPVTDKDTIYEFILKGSFTEDYMKDYITDFKVLGPKFDLYSKAHKTTVLIRSADPKSKITISFAGTFVLLINSTKAITFQDVNLNVVAKTTAYHELFRSSESLTFKNVGYTSTNDLTYLTCSSNSVLIDGCKTSTTLVLVGFQLGPSKLIIKNSEIKSSKPSYVIVIGGSSDGSTVDITGSKFLSPFKHTPLGVHGTIKVTFSVNDTQFVQTAPPASYASGYGKFFVYGNTAVVKMLNVVFDKMYLLSFIGTFKMNLTDVTFKDCVIPIRYSNSIHFQEYHNLNRVTFKGLSFIGETASTSSHGFITFVKGSFSNIHFEDMDLSTFPRLVLFTILKPNVNISGFVYKNIKMAVAKSGNVLNSLISIQGNHCNVIKAEFDKITYSSAEEITNRNYYYSSLIYVAYTYNKLHDIKVSDTSAVNLIAANGHYLNHNVSSVKMNIQNTKVKTIVYNYGAGNAIKGTSAAKIVINNVTASQALIFNYLNSLTLVHWEITNSIAPNMLLNRGYTTFTDLKVKNQTCTGALIENQLNALYFENSVIFEDIRTLKNLMFSFVSTSTQYLYLFTRIKMKNIYANTDATDTNLIAKCNAGTLIVTHSESRTSKNKTQVNYVKTIAHVAKSSDYVLFPEKYMASTNKGPFSLALPQAHMNLYVDPNSKCSPCSGKSDAPYKYLGDILEDMPGASTLTKSVTIHVAGSEVIYFDSSKEGARHNNTLDKLGAKSIKIVPSGCVDSTCKKNVTVKINTIPHIKLYVASSTLEIINMHFEYTLDKNITRCTLYAGYSFLFTGYNTEVTLNGVGFKDFENCRSYYFMYLKANFTMKKSFIINANPRGYLFYTIYNSMTIEDSIIKSRPPTSSTPQHSSSTTMYLMYYTVKKLTLKNNLFETHATIFMVSQNNLHVTIENNIFRGDSATRTISNNVRNYVSGYNNVVSFKNNIFEKIKADGYGLSILLIQRQKTLDFTNNTFRDIEISGNSKTFVDIVQTSGAPQLTTKDLVFENMFFKITNVPGDRFFAMMNVRSGSLIANNFTLKNITVNTAISSYGYYKLLNSENVLSISDSRFERIKSNTSLCLVTSSTYRTTTLIPRTISIVKSTLKDISMSCLFKNTVTYTLKTTVNSVELDNVTSRNVFQFRKSWDIKNVTVKNSNTTYLFYVYDPITGFNSDVKDIVVKNTTIKYDAIYARANGKITNLTVEGGSARRLVYTLSFSVTLNIFNVKNVKITDQAFYISTISASSITFDGCEINRIAYLGYASQFTNLVIKNSILSADLFSIRTNVSFTGLTIQSVKKTSGTAGIFSFSSSNKMIHLKNSKFSDFENLAIFVGHTYPATIKLEGTEQICNFNLPPISDTKNSFKYIFVKDGSTAKSATSLLTTGLCKCKDFKWVTGIGLTYNANPTFTVNQAAGETLLGQMVKNLWCGNRITLATFQLTAKDTSIDTTNFKTTHSISIEDFEAAASLCSVKFQGKTACQKSSAECAHSITINSADFTIPGKTPIIENLNVKLPSGVILQNLFGTTGFEVVNSRIADLKIKSLAKITKSTTQITKITDSIISNLQVEDLFADATFLGGVLEVKGSTIQNVKSNSALFKSVAAITFEKSTFKNIGVLTTSPTGKTTEKITADGSTFENVVSFSDKELKLDATVSNFVNIDNIAKKSQLKATKCKFNSVKAFGQIQSSFQAVGSSFQNVDALPVGPGGPTQLTLSHSVFKNVKTGFTGSLSLTSLSNLTFENFDKSILDLESFIGLHMKGCIIKNVNTIYKAAIRKTSTKFILQDSNVNGIHQFTDVPQGGIVKLINVNALNVKYLYPQTGAGVMSIQDCVIDGGDPTSKASVSVELSGTTLKNFKTFVDYSAIKSFIVSGKNILENVDVFISNPTGKDIKFSNADISNANIFLKSNGKGKISIISSKFSNFNQIVDNAGEVYVSGTTVTGAKTAFTTTKMADIRGSTFSKVGVVVNTTVGSGKITGGTYVNVKLIAAVPLGKMIISQGTYTDVARIIHLTEGSKGWLTPAKYTDVKEVARVEDSTLHIGHGYFAKITRLVNATGNSDITLNRVVVSGSTDDMITAEGNVTVENCKLSNLPKSAFEMANGILKLKNTYVSSTRTIAKASKNVTIDVNGGRLDLTGTGFMLGEGIQLSLNNTKSMITPGVTANNTLLVLGEKSNNISFQNLGLSLMTKSGPKKKHRLFNLGESNNLTVGDSNINNWNTPSHMLELLNGNIVSLDNVKLTSNSADSIVRADDNNTVNISSSNMKSSAGFVYAMVLKENNTLNIEESTFDKGYSLSGGLVRAFEGNNIMIKDSNISRFTAGKRGGMIFAGYENKIKVLGGNMENAKAEFGGFAFLKVNNSLTVNLTTFRNIKSRENGGFIDARKFNEIQVGNASLNAISAPGGHVLNLVQENEVNFNGLTVCNLDRPYMYYELIEEKKENTLYFNNTATSPKELIKNFTFCEKMNITIDNATVCKRGSFFNTTSMNCSKCINNCTTCTSEDVCTSCPPRLAFFEGKCLDKKKTISKIFLKRSGDNLTISDINRYANSIKEALGDTADSDEKEFCEETGEETCENGGKCNSDRKCECVNGFWGLRCENDQALLNETIGKVEDAAKNLEEQVGTLDNLNPHHAIEVMETLGGIMSNKAAVSANVTNDSVNIFQTMAKDLKKMKGDKKKKQIVAQAITEAAGQLLEVLEEKKGSYGASMTEESTNKVRSIMKNTIESEGESLGDDKTYSTLTHKNMFISVVHFSYTNLNNSVLSQMHGTIASSTTFKHNPSQAGKAIANTLHPKFQLSEEAKKMVESNKGADKTVKTYFSMEVYKKGADVSVTTQTAQTVHLSVKKTDGNAVSMKNIGGDGIVIAIPKRRNYNNGKMGKCVYNKNGVWSDEGVTFVRETDKEIYCRTKHLSEFSSLEIGIPLVVTEASRAMSLVHIFLLILFVDAVVIGLHMYMTSTARKNRKKLRKVSSIEKADENAIQEKPEISEKADALALRKSVEESKPIMGENDQNSEKSEQTDGNKIAAEIGQDEKQVVEIEKMEKTDTATAYPVIASKRGTGTSRIFTTQENFESQKELTAQSVDRKTLIPLYSILKSERNLTKVSILLEYWIIVAFFNVLLNSSKAITSGSSLTNDSAAVFVSLILGWICKYLIAYGYQSSKNKYVAYAVNGVIYFIAFCTILGVAHDYVLGQQWVGVLGMAIIFDSLIFDPIMYGLSYVPRLFEIFKRNGFYN